MQHIHSKTLQDYFAGRCSFDEAERVRVWFIRNAGSEEFGQALRVLWDEVPDLRDERRARDAYALFCRNLNTAPQTPRGSAKPAAKPHAVALRWLQRVAAVAAIPLLGVAFYLADQTRKPKNWVEEYVPYGQKKEVILPDHSSIWLNAGSKIVYPEHFNARLRQVYVIGEAFIDVTRDTGKPFYLSVGTIRIRVLGTGFNVKSYLEEDRTEISLVEGSISLEVDHNGEIKRYRMAPGSSMSFNHISGEMDARRFSVSEYASWRDGSGLYFRNIPLEEIMRDLERRFDVKIIIRSEPLKQEKYFASFVNDESLADILDALNVGGEMRYDRQGNVIDIYRARK